MFNMMKIRVRGDSEKEIQQIITSFEKHYDVLKIGSILQRRNKYKEYFYDCYVNLRMKG